MCAAARNGRSKTVLQVGDSQSGSLLNECSRNIFRSHIAAILGLSARNSTQPVVADSRAKAYLSFAAHQGDVVDAGNTLIPNHRIARKQRRRSDMFRRAALSGLWRTG